RGATASLASVKPGQGYDFAFPTKIYASAACGAPVVFTGVGPGADFVRQHGLGSAAEYEVDAVAAALTEVLEAPTSELRRAEIATWASENLTLDAVADRATAAIRSATLC